MTYKCESCLNYRDKKIYYINVTCVYYFRKDSKHCCRINKMTDYCGDSCQFFIDSYSENIFRKIIRKLKEINLK